VTVILCFVILLITFLGISLAGHSTFFFRLFLLYGPRLLLVLYLLRDGSSLAGLMVSLLGTTSLFSFGLMQLPGNLHLKSILRRDMFRCTPVYVSKTALRSTMQKATEALINIISLMMPIFLCRKCVKLTPICKIVCVSVFHSTPVHCHSRYSYFYF
jgi:hypothetical protein